LVKTLFFMPVFDEIRALPMVLDEFKSARLEGVALLLVNNGSTDGSEEVVRASGHHVIEFERNMGIGYAYMKSLEWALERDYQIFGTMAANGKMLPAEIPRLIGPIIEGEADYVTGSRFMPGGASPNLPAFRRMSIGLVNLFVWMITGVKLTDATCGFRAFRLELIRRANFDWHAEWLHTYGLEYYLDAKAVMEPRIRFVEVPVTMRYPAEGSYSKIRPGVDWLAMLRPWFAARFDGKGFDL